MIGKKSKRDTHERPDADVDDAPPVNDADPSADAEAAAADGEDAASEVDALRAEVAQWEDKFLRAKAEQQNALRRAENQARVSIRYANADLLRSLLEVADDLDRTIEVAGQSVASQSVASQSVAGNADSGSGESDASGVLIEGVRLIHGKIKKILADNGVTAIEAVGETFDPSLHEALMQQASDEHDAGTVIQQVQPGYTLHDRVLRPTKVIVAAAKPDDTDAGDADEE